MGILVVDDEELVRSVLEGMLESLGHQVELCASGTEAVQQLGDAPESIGLVICDLKLGGLQGRRLFEQLRAISPQLKIILISGNIEKDELESLNELGICGVLSKPFSLDSLRTELERCKASL